MAKRWPKPRAEHDSGRHRGVADTLHSQTKQWATPRTSWNENRTTKPTPSQERGDHGAYLAVQSIQVSRLHPTITPDGSESLSSDPTSRPRLNPDFTDWLMNLVPGWTGLEPLVMPWLSGRQPQPLSNYDAILESDEGAA
jgi:hypothetical protein